jgi:ADP-ribose pyrophosphatase YjhB (NUDIX family)
LPRGAAGRNDDMSEATQTQGGWLSQRELRDARERLPILYVEAVPVRVDDRGVVTTIGLLLRASAQGVVDRELVSGRVLYHERVRDALLRHLEKDLGPLAMPRIPLSPHPFTVAEYFPTPGVTPFHDPRQHAVSLAYIVPVLGDCSPQQDALDLAWVTPEEAASLTALGEMRGGHSVLLRQALAFIGHPV